MLNLKTASESFLKWLKVQNYAPATLVHYRIVFKEFGFFLKERGLLDLRGLTKGHLEGFKEVVFSENIVLSSKAKKINRLKKFFIYLTKNHFFLWDPVEVLAVKNPPRSKKIVSVLSKKEMSQLMKVAGQKRKYPQKNWLRLRNVALVELIYSTGLRVSEVIGLKVDEVNLKDGEVFVSNGKGGRDRVVPLGNYAGQAILSYLENLRPQLACRQEPSFKELFLTEHGKVLDKSILCWIIKRHAREVGIKKRVYPHLLRHTMATHLLNAGAPLVIVKGLLGHVCLQSTQIYTHVTFEELRKIYLQYHPRGNRCLGSLVPKFLGTNTLMH